MDEHHRRIIIALPRSPVNDIRLICLLMIGFAIMGCKPKEDYSTYDSTNRYVRATYSAEIMEPDKSDIHKVEYYPSSPEKWLLVYFRSDTNNGYTYQNFPSEQWESWRASSDPYKWYKYNVKGRSDYRFKANQSTNGSSQLGIVINLIFVVIFLGYLAMQYWFIGAVAYACLRGYSKSSRLYIEHGVKISIACLYCPLIIIGLCFFQSLVAWWIAILSLIVARSIAIRASRKQMLSNIRRYDPSYAQMSDEQMLAIAASNMEQESAYSQY